MQTSVTGIDWLISGEPRPAQIEALLRSYRGQVWRRHKDEEWPKEPALLLPHTGNGPAIGWAHFMEMRVGKTPTALNEFMLLRRDFGIGRMLILSPPRYKATWGTETEFFIPNAPVFVIESSKIKHFDKWRSKYNRGVVVMNYEAMRSVEVMKRIWDWVEEPCFLVADESVTIKSNTSSLFKSALAISKKAHLVRPMTGLPNPQSPADFWSQMRFARQLNGVNYYAFRGKYCKMGGYKKKAIVGTRNEDQLDAFLTRHSFRAKRRDWGTKIDSDYELVPVSMTKKQAEAYHDMDNSLITWLDDTEYVSTDLVITKRMKMQQISSGFIIDEYEKTREIVPFEKTPKFLDLYERLSSEFSGKVLILAYFTETVRRLLDGLAEFNPTMIAGEGMMKQYHADAEAEKKRFNEDPNCRVMVAQSDAVKYGHTLMGSRDNPCLDLCFFENNYNLDTRSQCEERPQGEGQQAAIHIWDYFGSPIERHIVQSLQDKRNVSDLIMDYYERMKNADV